MQKLTDLTKEELIELIIRERESSSAWQPIESAPRDGTLILCVDKDGVMEVCFYTGQGDFMNHISYTYCEPTHWQPLPEPPMEA